MSYDIDLLDPVSKSVIEFDGVHQIKGGTYQLGGTREASLNVTYNYCRHFCRTIDEKKGIRFLYGKSGAESIPILEKAIGMMADDVDDDYWKPTEGNAKQALYSLLAFAKMRPDGIWSGD
jgi:hypothetical protein